MTINGTIITNGAFTFTRLCIRGTIPPNPDPTSFLLGVAAGDLLGFSRGFGFGTAAGRPDGEEEGLDTGRGEGFVTGLGTGLLSVAPARVSGFAAGESVGFSRGLGAGMAIPDAEGDGYEIGRMDGFGVGFATGVSSVPEAVDPGPPETDPPEIGVDSPDAGVAPGGSGFPGTYAAAKLIPIQIPVADDESSIVFVVISLRYPGITVWETVYSGAPGIEGNAAFKPGWAVSGAVSGDGEPTIGFTFSLLPDGGWPAISAAYSVEVDTRAVDSVGNVL